MSEYVEIVERETGQESIEVETEEDGMMIIPSQFLTNTFIWFLQVRFLLPLLEANFLGPQVYSTGIRIINYGL